MDGNGDTTDPDKEHKNFRKAGNLLSDIWSNTMIDGEPVCVSLVDVSEKPVFLRNLLKSWLEEHVQIFRYCYQISKSRMMNAASF